MRDFSKISPSVWTSKKFTGLASNEARLAYLYFLTGKHQTNAGVSSVPPAYVAHDLNWSVEEVEQIITQLQAAELIEYDEDTNELLIVNWFKHNVPMNAKHRKGIVYTLERVESSLLYETGLVALEEVYFDPEASGPNKKPTQEQIELENQVPEKAQIAQQQTNGTPYTASAEAVVDAVKRGRKQRLPTGFGGQQYA